MPRDARQNALHAAGEKRRRDKRKKEFWEGKTCSECGVTEDLVFHHPNGVRDDSPTKKPSGRTSLWYLSKEDFERELEDVVIVCVPCHKAIHAPVCGTRAKYVTGCRCQECRQANTERSRAWLAIPENREKKNAARRKG